MLSRLREIEGTITTGGRLVRVGSRLSAAPVAIGESQLNNGPLMNFSRELKDPIKCCLGIFSLGAIVIYILPLIWALGARAEFGMPLNIHNVDFVNYWMAGRMTLAGEQQQLFTHEVYFAHLQQIFGVDAEIRSWSYPPHFLLFLWPLGLLEFSGAMSAFLVVTFGLFLYATAVFARVYGPSDRWVLVLALPSYVAMMLVATQNGFLTAAVLLLGLAWMKDKPVLAGLMFGVLTIKPQLGFLIPILLAFDRNWATARWSVIATVLLVGLSLVLFGMESWHAYLAETLAYQRSVMTDWHGIFLRMMPTVFGSMRTLGFDQHLAEFAQWPVSMAGVLVVLWVLCREANPLRRVFAVTCGTFVITPYAFNYDMGALTVVAAVLVGSAQAPKSRAGKMVIALVAVLPGVITNLGRANVPLAPLLLFAALAVVAAEAAKRSGAASHTSPVTQS